VIWSNYKPDPNRPECVQAFDPSQAKGGECGVQVHKGDNVDIDGKSVLGFWYAPNPFESSSTSMPTGFANPGRWTQLIGIDGEETVASGNSFCSREMTDAITFSNCDTTAAGQPFFIIFCEASFNPPADKSDWVNHNINNEYWNEPNAPGSLLDDHQGSLSFHMIHELGHALCLCKSSSIPLNSSANSTM